MDTIPAHWELIRIKTLLFQRREKGHAHEPLLAATQEQGVIRKERYEHRTVIATKDLELLKLVRKGDFVISLRSFQGGIEFARDQGIISPAYTILCPRDKSHIPYLVFLFKSETFVDSLSLFTTGIREGQNIDYARLSRSYLPLPPPAEQRAIVRFLDRADRRIRQYIRAKQKLIALREEQKQAIIHHAVTGQIDVRTGQPYPAYRTSRTECLGGIPKHWKLARLKDVAQVQPGLTLGKDYGSIETVSRPYLRVANVQDGRIDLSHVKSVEVPVHEARATTLLDGDVLMTEGGDIDKLGRGGIWRDEIRGCLHQNHIFAVRCCQESLKPEFLVGLMASSYGRSYFQLTAKQTTNLASTNSNTLRAFPIPLPSVDEQKVILRFLSRDTRVVDESIGRTERLIHGVREYRARLINDVVTGRVDVRDALASRPDRMPVEEFRGEQEGVTV